MGGGEGCTLASQDVIVDVITGQAVRVTITACVYALLHQPGKTGSWGIVSAILLTLVLKK